MEQAQAVTASLGANMEIIRKNVESVDKRIEALAAI